MGGGVTLKRCGHRKVFVQYTPVSPAEAERKKAEAIKLWVEIHQPHPASAPAQTESSAETRSQ